LNHSQPEALFPNLTAFRNRASLLQAHVHREIDEAATESQKILLVRRWAFVLHELEALNNWHSLAAVNAALYQFTGTPKLWGDVPEEVKRKVPELQLLFTAPTQKNNLKAKIFGALRTLPAVPHLAPIFEEINFVENEQYPDLFLRITNWSIKCVHFERCRALSELLHRLVLVTQRILYNFATVPLIVQWLKHGASPTPMASPRGSLLSPSGTDLPGLLASPSRLKKRKKAAASRLAQSTGSVSPTTSVRTFTAFRPSPTKSTPAPLSSSTESSTSELSRRSDGPPSAEAVSTAVMQLSFIATSIELLEEEEPVDGVH